MVKYLLYITMFSILFLQNSRKGYTQKILEVVEKKVERQIKVSEDGLVKFTAQKANIEVKGWDKKEVKIILRIKSSNSDKATAEKELNYVKYGFLKENNTLEIQNAFVVPGDVARILSLIMVEYEVWIPKHNSIYISNRYGDVSITGTSGVVHVNLDLGNLVLDQLNSRGKVIITYGDILGTELAGNWNIVSSKSKIDISNAAGSYYLHSNYGEVNFSAGGKLNKLEIEADRTEAFVNLGLLTQYNYNLSTSHSNIMIPNEEYKKQISHSGRGNVLLKINSNKNYPLIKINTSYSPIIIKGNN